MDAGDLTTEAILQAALVEFGSHGFRATSLSQIASAAKVSRPTLYARYPEKIKLFRAVLEHGYSQALEASKHAAESEGTLEDVLGGVLRGYYGTLFDRYHGLPQIDELILVQSEEAEDMVLAAREKFRRLIGQMLRKQIDGGAIDPDRLTMPIAQLVDLIRLTPMSLKTPSVTRAQYRRGLANLARLVAQALTKE